MEIKKLKPNPKNDVYFDNITGEAWTAFLESIKTSGVVEPVIISEDFVITSGHQRVKACKELGIDKVPVEIKKYESEDEQTKQLIETNIRQRGIGNTNPIKFGLCIRELERIYGIHQGTGSNQYKQKPNNSDFAKTQEQLASEMGISVDTMQNFKKLADMIPEMQDLVETGIVTPTTARAIIKQLSEDDQKMFAKELSEKGEKVSGRQADFYAKRIKELQDEVHELQSRKPEIRTVEVEPDDYQDIKERNKAWERDYRKLQADKNRSLETITSLNERIKELETRESVDELKEKLRNDAEYFSLLTTQFISKIGGYVWITEHIDELPDYMRKRFIQDIRNIDGWAQQMILNIGGNIK